MATFVLVHGGWFGGWCWREVADKLRQQGHLVYAPTLTGLGERTHLVSAQITLKTHAQDIANVLIYEDLQDVILLGHSYSGMPLTLVPKLAGDRIQRLVYLDAFVPQDGQCLADLVDVPANGNQHWLTPPPSLSRWHVTDPEVIEKIGNRLTPHPSIVRHERVDLSGAPALPSTYVSLTRKQKRHFVKTADSLTHTPNWQIINLDAGHLVMIENPDLLVNCLLTLIQ